MEEYRVPEKSRRDLFANILLGVDLFFVAFLFISNIAAQIIGFTAPPLTAGAAYGNAIFLILCLGVVPLIWGYLRFGNQVWERFQFGELKRGSWLGILLLFATVATVLVIGGILQFFLGSDVSPLASELKLILTIPLILVMAFGAAFGEEVFFRGLMQPKIGVWATSIIFGLVHAGYGTVSQIIVPIAIGLVYGLIQKRFRNLWMCMIAHFLYDVIAFSVLKWVDF